MSKLAAAALGAYGWTQNRNFDNNTGDATSGQIGLECTACTAGGDANWTVTITLPAYEGLTPRQSVIRWVSV